MKRPLEKLLTFIGFGPSVCSGLRWTTNTPMVEGWYWMRAPNLSPRPVKFFKGMWGMLHCNEWAPWKLHGEPYEYAGPIPTPPNYEVAREAGE